VRKRNLVIAIGLVVAVAAAAVGILSVQDQKMLEADSRGPSVTVIVSKEDIPADQLLDPLIEEGVFRRFEIPTVALVEGAVTDVEELRGTRAHVLILANEQISSSRLTSADPPYAGTIPPARVASHSE
jgi:Flp pilus assembly protein CpaB